MRPNLNNVEVTLPCAGCGRVQVFEVERFIVNRHPQGAYLAHHLIEKIRKAEWFLVDDETAVCTSCYWQKVNKEAL